MPPSNLCSNRKTDAGRGARYSVGGHMNANGNDSGNTSANSSIPADVWKNNRRVVSKSYDGHLNAAKLYHYESNRNE